MALFLVFGRGTAAELLQLPVLALRVDTGTFGRARWFRVFAGRRDMEGSSQPGPKPFERELAILMLRPAFRRGDSDRWAEPFSEAGALARAERRRVFDIEAEFDLGVRRVGVLAARAAGAGEAPLEFIERYRAGATHAQPAAVHGPGGYVPRRAAKRSFGDRLRHPQTRRFVTDLRIDESSDESSIRVVEHICPGQSV